MGICIIYIILLFSYVHNIYLLDLNNLYLQNVQNNLQLAISSLREKLENQKEKLFKNKIHF